MNHKSPDLIECGLCGRKVTGIAFDEALQKPIGKCCVQSLQIADVVLAKAGFTHVTHNPDHEK